MLPSVIVSNSKAYETITSTLSKMTSSNDLKVKDLEHDLKNYHDGKNRLTSDTGVKQNNTDDWLRVVNDDQTGSMLLEDTFAREKVRGRLRDILKF
jgi:catalase